MERLTPAGHLGQHSVLAQRGLAGTLPVVSVGMQVTRNGPLSRISHSPFDAADFILQVSEDGINWVMWILLKTTPPVQRKGPDLIRHDMSGYL